VRACALVRLGAGVVVDSGLHAQWQSNALRITTNERVGMNFGLCCVAVYARVCVCVAVQHQPARSLCFLLLLAAGRISFARRVCSPLVVDVILV